MKSVIEEATLKSKLTELNCEWQALVKLSAGVVSVLTKLSVTGVCLG